VAFRAALTWFIPFRFASKAKRADNKFAAGETIEKIMIYTGLSREGIERLH